MEAAAPPPASPRRLDVSTVLGETFSIWGRHLPVLVGVAILVYIIVAPLAGLLDNAEGWFLSLCATAIRLAGAAVYTGFVVELVRDVRDGRRDSSFGQLISAGAPAIGVLIVNGFLWGLGVMVGFVLVIIPGLVLLTFWAVCAPAIVVERCGPIEAFGRSWELVKGNGWEVFSSLLLVWLILAGAFVVTVIVGVATGFWLLLVLGAI